MNFGFTACVINNVPLINIERITYFITSEFFYIIGYNVSLVLIALLKVFPLVIVTPDRL